MPPDYAPSHDPIRAVVFLLAGAAPGAAATAAEELQRMRHSMITAGLPISLLVHNKPAEFRALIEGWRVSVDITDVARNACTEALGQA